MTPEQRLYEFTRALASGVAVAEGTIKSFLPNIYLENKRIYGTAAPLVYEGDVPDRLPQAYDDYLNRIGLSLGVFRGPNEKDDAYRQKIKLRLVQSPTLNGISSSIVTVFSGLGLDVNVISSNTRDDFFDAVDSNLDTTLRGTLGARSYRITIEVTPGFKESYPRYVDKFLSGRDYRIKKSGLYRITFDPYNFSGTSSISLTTKNYQFPSRNVLTFSSFALDPGFSVDLGFLSTFQGLFVTAGDGSNLNYESRLEFNNNVFDFYKNPAYNGLLTAFGVNFLREIFQDTLPFGVNIERIIVRQAGTGG